MQVVGGGVSRLAAVDDDHGPALAPELERGGKPGGRSSDDGDVAVSFDGAGGMVGHDIDDRVDPEGRTSSCDIRKSEGVMVELDDIEQVVRIRLRSLRRTLGLSLDELVRPHQPQSLHHQPGRDRQAHDQSRRPATAGCALQVDLDALLDVRNDDDVVIRPAPRRSSGRTTWMLSRPTGSTIAVKMRFEPSRTAAEQRVHPGHDWFFVIEGRVSLSLGERRDQPSKPARPPSSPR